MIVHVAFALALQGPAPDHWFGSDKLKHFFMAAFTQSVAYSALQAARVRHDQALAGAWAVTATVSVAKEIHDRRSYGLFSVRDLVWDAAGAGAATLLITRSVRTTDGGGQPAETSRAAGAPFGAPLLSGVARSPILALLAQQGLSNPAPRR
jgi:putative lipoprotein